MDNDSIVAAIDAELGRLQQARALLSGISTASDGKTPAPTKKTPRRRRRMSPEARKRIADAQRKRWAAVKAAKAPVPKKKAKPAEKPKAAKKAAGKAAKKIVKRATRKKATAKKVPVVKTRKTRAQNRVAPGANALAAAAVTETASS
jgi:hypothetical protein